mmetsp:Transcript_9906/g.28081  ORF Transcript_9906/g.28081 Transcript_9906/m.28081 type:complete len:557 (-) Transcript_9906:251-1921(-)
MLLCCIIALRCTVSHISTGLKRNTNPILPSQQYRPHPRHHLIMNHGLKYCLDHIQDHELTEGPKRCSNSADGVAFPWRLHEVLEAADHDGFSHIISWLPGDFAFKVHDARAFEAHVIPKYLASMTQYKSFLRQLNLYNFQRISSKGELRGSYHHPHFSRSRKSLCNRMSLTKVKGARRIVSHGGGGGGADGRKGRPAVVIRRERNVHGNNNGDGGTGETTTAKAHLLQSVGYNEDVGDVAYPLRTFIANNAGDFHATEEQAPGNELGTAYHVGNQHNRATFLPENDPLLIENQPYIALPKGLPASMTYMMSNEDADLEEPEPLFGAFQRSPSPSTIEPIEVNCFGAVAVPKSTFSRDIIRNTCADATDTVPPFLGLHGSSSSRCREGGYRGGEDVAPPSSQNGHHEDESDCRHLWSMKTATANALAEMFESDDIMLPTRQGAMADNRNAITTMAPATKNADHSGMNKHADGNIGSKPHSRSHSARNAREEIDGTALSLPLVAPKRGSNSSLSLVTMTCADMMLEMLEPTPLPPQYHVLRRDEGRFTFSPHSPSSRN